MRVANHKLEAYFAERKPVENYNGTIVGEITPKGDYLVTHWGAGIAAYNDKDFAAYPHFISQTSATLLGRVMRSQPRANVVEWIDGQFNSGNIDAKRKRQLLAQLR